jgi:hypothetical protein
MKRLRSLIITIQGANAICRCSQRLTPYKGALAHCIITINHKMLVSSPDGSWCEFYAGLTSVSVQSVLACGMSGFYEEFVGVQLSTLY